MWSVSETERVLWKTNYTTKINNLKWLFSMSLSLSHIISRIIVKLFDPARLFGVALFDQTCGYLFMGSSPKVVPQHLSRLEALAVAQTEWLQGARVLLLQKQAQIIPVHHSTAGIRCLSADVFSLCFATQSVVRCGQIFPFWSCMSKVMWFLLDILPNKPHLFYREKVHIYTLTELWSSLSTAQSENGLTLLWHPLLW